MSKTSLQAKQIQTSQLECIQETLEVGESVIFHVSGACMYPLLKDQESILIRKASFFFPGDLIVYYCQYNKKPFIHRFLGYVRTKLGWKLLIMADSTKRPDTLVSKSAVLGKGFINNQNIETRTQLSIRFRSVWRYFYGAFYIARSITSRRLKVKLAN